MYEDFQTTSDDLKTNILIIHLKLNMHFPKIKILKDYVVLFQTKKPAFTLAIDIEAKNKIIATKHKHHKNKFASKQTRQ